jgi:hypothetical protein
MAKRRKVLPARKPRDRSRDDDSLLLRSAESLGRVIGALQRQLDEATHRLKTAAPGAAAKKGTKRSRKTKGATKAAKGSRKTTRSRAATKKR